MKRKRAEEPMTKSFCESPFLNRVCHLNWSRRWDGISRTMLRKGAASNTAGSLPPAVQWLQTHPPLLRRGGFLSHSIDNYRVDMQSAKLKGYRCSKVEWSSSSADRIHTMYYQINLTAHGILESSKQIIWRVPIWIPQGAVVFAAGLISDLK